MKWIKYFESFNNKEILDGISDILLELEDNGYRIQIYNRNPQDVPVVRDNINGYYFAIDKNYIQTSSKISPDEFPFIVSVLDRLKDYLEIYNIKLKIETYSRFITGALKRVRHGNYDDTSQLTTTNNTLNWLSITREFPITDDLAWIGFKLSS